MTVFHVRNKLQSWYGESIGILILDAAYPCVPGNVGNASTFDFPVRYKVVKNASIDRLLNQRDPSLLEPFIEAARELQDEGVKAVTGACGFMALFQRQVADALDIPVFLSSLLQVPVYLSDASQRPKNRYHFRGFKCVDTGAFFQRGHNPGHSADIGGMENQMEFREAVLLEKGTLDSDQIQREVVEIAEQMVGKAPGYRRDSARMQ